jgi:hypothetical protein
MQDCGCKRYMLRYGANSGFWRDWGTSSTVARPRITVAQYGGQYGRSPVVGTLPAEVRYILRDTHSKAPEVRSLCEQASGPW